MRLYIANCTMQSQHLMYRLPEKKSALTQVIPGGAQQMIGNSDLSKIAVEGVIDPLRAYGLLVASEASGLRDRKQGVNLVASIDSPVTKDLIERVLRHNQGVKHLMGKEFREQAAIATSLEIAKTTPAAAQELEMTIQEQESPGIDHSEFPAINEGMRMAGGSGGAPEGGGRSGPRATRRARQRAEKG